MDIKTLREVQDQAELANDHQRALWYDLNGDWDTAHSIVQQMTDVNAMWIHAYLHRKEPDLSNARYWYRSAGKPFPGEISYQSEAESILSALVA